MSRARADVNSLSWWAVSCNPDRIAAVSTVVGGLMRMESGPVSGGESSSPGSPLADFRSVLSPSTWDSLPHDRVDSSHDMPPRGVAGVVVDQEPRSVVASKRTPSAHDTGHGAGGPGHELVVKRGAARNSWSGLLLG